MPLMDYTLMNWAIFLIAIVAIGFIWRERALHDRETREKRLKLYQGGA